MQFGNSQRKTSKAKGNNDSGKMYAMGTVLPASPMVARISSKNTSDMLPRKGLRTKPGNTVSSATISRKVSSAS